jgi:hypothetical protein
MVWCGVVWCVRLLLLLLYCESSRAIYIKSSIVILLLLSVLNAIACLENVPLSAVDTIHDTINDT